MSYALVLSCQRGMNSYLVAILVIFFVAAPGASFLKKAFTISSGANVGSDSCDLSASTYGSRRLTSKPDSAGAKPVFIVAKGREGNATEYGMKYRIMVK